jgi:cell wall assembly regulator SMI1
MILTMPQVATAMRAAATEARLREAEAVLGVTIPEPLRGMYRIFDGMARYHFIGKWQLYCLEERVARGTFRLDSELRHLFHQAGLPRG